MYHNHESWITFHIHTAIVFNHFEKQKNRKEIGGTVIVLLYIVDGRQRGKACKLYQNFINVTQNIIIIHS